MKTKILLTVILAIVLASCMTTPAPTETAIPIASSTFVPPASLTPVYPTSTITPIPSIESLPEMQKSVSEFSSALQVAGINITAEQILQQGVKIKTLTGKDGKTYEIATVQIDPDPKVQGETLEGDYPLMIKTSDGIWGEATFKKFGELSGIMIGTSVDDVEGYQNPVYRNAIIGNFNMLFTSGAFYSEDLRIRPEVATSFRSLSDEGNDIFYIHPGIWKWDQGYLKDCKSADEVKIAIEKRATSQLNYVNKIDENHSKPTYVNIYNEPFLAYLDGSGNIRVDWKDTIAYKYLGRDTLVETYIAFAKIAESKGLEIGKDVIFTFSEYGIDTDNLKTKLALKEFEYTKKEVARRLNIPIEKVKISLALEKRYEATFLLEQPLDDDNVGRSKTPTPEQLTTSIEKFKSLFDEILFTETAISNATAEQRREVFNMLLEVAKNTGVPAIIFEAPLRWVTEVYPNSDASAKNTDFFTKDYKKTMGYYYFLMNMMSHIQSN